MRALILLLAASVALSAAETLPSLQTQPNDMIFLGDNQPIFGTIVSQEADGSVVFEEMGKPPKRYLATQVRSVQPRRNEVDVIAQRAKILLAAAAPDEANILLTLKWGVDEAAKATTEQKADLATAITAVVRTMARDSARKHPGNERIVAAAMPLMKADEAERAAFEEILRAVIQATPGNDRAYENLVEILRATDRGAQVRELAKQWVKNCRSSVVGNRTLAALSEEAGELTDARDAYARLYTTSKDPEAGVGLARTSFLLGQLDNAYDTAGALVAAGSTSADAGVIAGSVLLRRGEAAQAKELLVTALAGKPNPVLVATGTWNLGLACLRTGDRPGAKAAWERCDHPLAAFGLAQLDRRMVSEIQRLPEAVRPLAQEHNACLLIEAKDSAKAVALLKPEDHQRHRVLAWMARLLEEGGSKASVELLAGVAGVEALRWQLYGHILGRRADEAQKIADQLPADDGYAAVCRVYLAALRKDEARARELYHAARSAVAPPAGYLARIAAEYEAENDEIVTHDFADWPAGAQLRQGWQSQNAGTGIEVKVADGALRLAGKQASSSTPETRVWTVVGAERLRSVAATLDLGSVGSARVGIEILNSELNSGVAVGILGDGGLAWRQRTGDVWTAWQPLPQGATGTVVELRLSVDARYNRVVVGGVQQSAVGANLDLMGKKGELRIGLFGVADAGQDWQLAARSLVVQMRGAQTGGAGGPRRR